MTSDEFEIAIIDLLEEIPLEEMDDSLAFVVNEFRSGFMEVTEATALLEEDFYDMIKEWVENNKRLELC